MTITGHFEPAAVKQDIFSAANESPATRVHADADISPRRVAYLSTRGRNDMTRKHQLGGIIHTYQKYDPKRFPSPTQPPADLLSPAFEHMLAYGSMRHLTDEELARAVRIDPSQIAGLGPSIDALLAMLLERKRKILEKYETDTVQQSARKAYREAGATMRPPRQTSSAFRASL